MYLKEHQYDVPFLACKGRQMNTFRIKSDIETVYVKEDYFKKNSHLVKILDPLDYEKQSRRCYLFLKVEYEGNNLLVPLKSKVEPIKKYGRVGHSVPSSDKPEAGLEYRKILILNDEEYLEKPEFCKIPVSQQHILNAEYDKIRAEVKAYVDGYVKAAIKNRIDREPKFRESSLINFNEELKIEQKKNLKKLQQKSKQSITV